MISASLGSSDKFGDLVDRYSSVAEFAQALFPLIVINCDDFGRLEASPLALKRRVFQVSPRSQGEFQTALDALHDVRLIQLYRVEGKQYLQVVRFDEHQSGLQRRTQSRIPDPPQGNSLNFSEFPSEQNRTEENRREEKIQHSTARAREESGPAAVTQLERAGEGPVIPGLGGRVAADGIDPDEAVSRSVQTDEGSSRDESIGGRVATEEDSCDAGDDEDPSRYWAVVMHREVFKVTPPIASQELIAHNVTDRVVWARVLEIWNTNGHRPYKVWDMVDRYKREIEKQESGVDADAKSKRRDAAACEPRADHTRDAGAVTERTASLRSKAGRSLGKRPGRRRGM